MAQQQMTSAREIQQSYFNIIGETVWDEYTLRDRPLIKQKIAYAVFGVPTTASHVTKPIQAKRNVITIKEIVTEDYDIGIFDEKSTFGYTSEQLELVNPLYEKIKALKKYAPDMESIYMSIIFVCLVPEDSDVGHKNIMIDRKKFPQDRIYIEPVFRIRKCIKIAKNDNKFGCCLFVDINGRIYQDWDDYLENNKLNKGIIVAPENGRYSAQYAGNLEIVKLQIAISPSSTLGAKILSGMEIASTVAAVGTIGVVATSLVVPLGAAVGAATAGVTLATGVFGIGSSTRHLVDRGTHGQDIGLSDAQSRGSWINIAASTLGIASSATATLVSRAAASGSTVSRGIAMTHDAVLFSSLISNGTSIVNSLVNIHTQYKKTGNLPSNLELFQLASSVLFFTHSIISNKTARILIEESQATTITDYRNTLSRKERKAFDKMSKETRRTQGTMNGNAEIIRSTKIIGDDKSFFRNVAKTNKDLNKNRVRISFKDGKALLNGKHTINPKEFYAMNTEQRNTYLGTIGQADLTVPNDSTRISPSVKSNTGIIPAATSIISVISVSQLVESFPDISGNDELLLRYIAQKLTSLASEPYVYELFDKLINWLKNHIDDSLYELLTVLNITETKLLFKLFETCFDYLMNFLGEESDIPSGLRMFFKDGVIKEKMVLSILQKFKDIIQKQYNELTKQASRCSNCQGLKFSD